MRYAKLTLSALLVVGTAPARADLTKEQQATIDVFIKKADELINDRMYDVAAGKHYKVKTDDPRFVPAKATELLDGFRAFFDGFWAGKVEMRPYEQVGRFYLFYSRAKYKKLFNETHQDEQEWSIGHYREFFDIVAAHTDSVGPENLPDILIHEAAHQLVQQRLFGSGSRPWPWLAEGLASYFGYMERGADGTYKPERIGGKGIYLFKKGSPVGRGLGRGDLGPYAASLRKGEARRIAEMIQMEEQEAFYAEGREDRYAASWMLVHFLLHGDNGARAAGFMRFLAREATGDTVPDDLYQEIGMTADQLQAAFEAYVRKKG